MGRNIHIHMYKTQLVTIVLIGLAVGSIYAESVRTLQAIVKKPLCNISKNGRCGTQFGNTVCSAGNYCSQWNWCGNSKLHISTQQPKFSNGFGCKAKPAAKKSVKVTKKAKVTVKKPAAKAPLKKKGTVRVKITHRCPKGFSYNAKKHHCIKVTRIVRHTCPKGFTFSKKTKKCHKRIVTH